MRSLTTVSLLLLFISIALSFELKTFKHQSKFKVFQPVFDPYVDQKHDIAENNIRQRRARKQLKLAEQLDETTDGILGWILGYAKGLQYNIRFPGRCYQSIENHSLLIDEILDIFERIYLPENWGDAIFIYQDLIDVQASIYTHCDLQQFLTNIAELFTTEGVASLASRSLLGLIYEIPRYFNDFIDAQSTMEKGKALGHLTQIIFDYSIL